MINYLHWLGGNIISEHLPGNLYERLRELREAHRQRRLLAYRYGLKSMECKTISETAAFFNLTEKFIEEIEKGALKTLRDGMNDGKIV